MNLVTTLHTETDQKSQFEAMSGAGRSIKSKISNFFLPKTAFDLEPIARTARYVGPLAQLADDVRLAVLLGLGRGLERRGSVGQDQVDIGANDDSSKEL